MLTLPQGSAPDNGRPRAAIFEYGRSVQVALKPETTRGLRPVPTPPGVSVVVPTYGGHESLRPLVEQVSSTLRARGDSFEIVVVNDSSPDDSWALLHELTGEVPELRAIDLLHNHGQLSATMCGLAHARGRVVVTMDDDLQHPPDQILRLLDALAEHPEWDAVVGWWRRDEGLFRNLGSRVHGALDRLAWGTPKGFRHSAFRAMRRPVVDALVEHRTRHPIIGPLLRQTTNRVANVEVEHRDRPYGRSGFRFRTGVRWVVDNFLQGSTLPLKFLARFGLLAATTSAILFLVLVIRRLSGVPTLTGWTSLVLAITFFGGATLLGMGILGQYMHFIMREVRRPPRWAIRQELGDPAADARSVGEGEGGKGDDDAGAPEGDSSVKRQTTRR